MLSPTDAGVRSFIERSMIVRLATLSAKRRPFITPLWFVRDRDGTLYITTGPETRAGKNISQHPEVMLLFHGERAGRSDRVLRVRGTATCHRGLPSWRVLVRIALKYYVSPRGMRTELGNAGKWRLRTRYYGQVKGGFGHIRVVPDRAEFLQLPSG